MGIRQAVRALFSRRDAPPPSGAGVSFFSSSYPFSSRDISLNSTVQACGNIIGNAIATMPVNLIFTDPSGARKRAGWDPRFAMLKYRPNPSQTPVVFYRQGIGDILHKGNWYLWKTEIGGVVRSLTRLVPEGMVERYDGLTTIFCYAGKEYRDGPDCPIIRIPSLIVDDHGKGFPPLTFAKTAVMLGIQLDDYSLSSFGNGLNTKLIIDIAEEVRDQKMNEVQAAKFARTLAEYVRANYVGAENAGKPYIQFMGKASEIKGQSSNRDAELLESRKWQEQEICKILGPPPFLINGSGSVPYGNLEQAMTTFFNFHLKPYLFHIAQSFDRALLSAYEQGAYGFEFDFTSLLKPDSAGRIAYYKGLWGMGAMSADDIDAAENLPPNPNGTGAVRFVPAQNMPSEPEVIAAYMASAKLKAAEIVAGKVEPAMTDPALAAGSQAQ